MERIDRIPFEELVGKRVTAIYEFVHLESGGMDTGDVVIVLDDGRIIEFPYGGDTDFRLTSIPKRSYNLFETLEPYPVYSVNQEGKSVGEIAQEHAARRKTLLGWIKNIVGWDLFSSLYRPYKVVYYENKRKYLREQRIVDFIFYPDDWDRGFFLLENGYLITLIDHSMNGTGLAGLGYYENLESLVERKGPGYLKWTETGRICNEPTDDE